MKVIDFEWKSFENYSSLILADIDASKAKAVLVVGIADGGLPIANHLATLIRGKNNLSVMASSIRCQRPSTKIKKNNHKTGGFIRALLRVTPRFLSNLLRVFEHYKLSFRRKTDRHREVLICSDLIGALKVSEFVLIVDDAVDSGLSLKAVIDEVIGIVPSGALVKSLVITVTQKSPEIVPDYFMMKDVLVRFPWSLDAH